MCTRIISVVSLEAVETITDCKRPVVAANKTISKIQFKLSKDLTKCMLTLSENLVQLCFCFPKKQICLLERKGVTGDHGERQK